MSGHGNNRRRLTNPVKAVSKTLPSGTCLVGFRAGKPNWSGDHPRFRLLFVAAFVISFICCNNDISHKLLETQPISTIHSGNLGRYVCQYNVSSISSSENGKSAAGAK
mmetsp:Transcript_31664/g.63619  ORF Transcript_31664/g.63619 Transcript_31664/m.63619 type:complete len:108 (+) Transcript_31664:289-612(+)